jgi:hypothetical protein
MTDRSQKRNGVIALIVAMAGLAVCLLPVIIDTSIEDGAPAFIAFGCLLVLAGMIAAPIYFRRARVLAAMLSAECFLARWVVGESSSEKLEVIISKDGLTLNGELYTFSGYSCRLEAVKLETREDSSYLVFTLSLPAKYGRHKSKHDVPVPPAEMASALRVVSALATSCHPS